VPVAHLAVIRVLIGRPDVVADAELVLYPGDAGAPEKQRAETVYRRAVFPALGEELQLNPVHTPLRKLRRPD